MSIIQNVTDQIDGYAEEVANCVLHIKKRGFSTDEAIRITELAIKNMEVEEMHLEFSRKNGGTDYLGTLPTIAESIVMLADSIYQKGIEINFNNSLKVERED